MARTTIVCAGILTSASTLVGRRVRSNCQVSCVSAGGNSRDMTAARNEFNDGMVLGVCHVDDFCAGQFSSGIVANFSNVSAALGVARLAHAAVVRAVNVLSAHKCYCDNRIHSVHESTQCAGLQSLSPSLSLPLLPNCWCVLFSPWQFCQ